MISANGYSQDGSPCLDIDNKSAKKLFKKAVDELHNGKYTEASKILESAVEEEPDYLEAWWVLADVNSKVTNRTRKRDIAQKAYEEIIRICPAYEDFYAYYYLAKIYYATMNYESAHKMFELFLSADTEKTKDKQFEEALKLSEWAKFYADVYGNKVPFEPIKLNNISTTKWDEYLPIITLDNEYIYFTRREESPQYSSYGKEDGSVERFTVSKKLANGTFEEGVALPSPFNEQPNEGGATLTIDNRHLFYTRCKYLNNRYFNCDIYETDYQNGYWSEITPMGTEINMPDSWESMPSISSDGNTLYFVSDRKDGNIGGLDIYVSHKDKNGKWMKAKNMGKVINTPGNEKSPFIHTDSQTLYFSSASFDDAQSGEIHYGHKSLGGYDIFFSRLEDNNWTIPKNIGYPINTEENDLGFFVSTDGRNGFFASNRLNGGKNWDIYTFELYTEARPQKVLFLKGVLKDEETKEILTDGRIEIKNMKTKEVTQIPVNPETGEYAFATTFKTDFMLTVKQRDYVYISKYVSKKDNKYEIPAEIDFRLQKIQIGKPYNLEDIFFATDSDQLIPESTEIVESFFEFMNENSSINIEIQGHTDNIGTDEYNLDLSQRRAETVYKYLLNKGISAKRMTFNGYGESMPIADNSDEEGRQKNRRTIFVITQK